MINRIQIRSVEKDKDDGLIVIFTDGTSEGYVAEELLGLRPHRKPAKASEGNSELH